MVDGPMTQVEYAKGSDPLTQGIVELFAQTSPFLGTIRYINTQNGAYRYSLEGDLPGIAFRGINESYTPDYSIENPQVETTSIMGGEADVDLAILTRFGESRRSRETNRKVKRMARVWMSTIVNGDNFSEPREFDGLKRRLTGTQLIANSVAAGGAPLSLTNLDELMDQVTGDPSQKYFLMAPAMRRRFWQLIRDTSVSGFIMENRDSLGRPQISFANIPLMVPWEQAGPDTEAGFQPINFDEVGAGGGAAVTTSIYLCNTGGEDGLMGLQDSNVRTKDFDELETKPVKRVRVEATGGLVLENPYAAARLTSITDAAIVA